MAGRESGGNLEPGSPLRRKRRCEEPNFTNCTEARKFSDPGFIKGVVLRWRPLSAFERQATRVLSDALPFLEDGLSVKELSRSGEFES